MIVAEYDGRCPGCLAPIIADADEIERNADGEWCHVDCASD